MSIGILYETDEWSNQQLYQYLNDAGIETKLINLEKDEVDFKNIVKYNLIINRIFPSAYYRGYSKSTQIAGSVLRVIKDNGIPIVNSYESFEYDRSKLCIGNILDKNGIKTPEIYKYIYGSFNMDDEVIKYPCILKPDCGGRSSYTYIIDNKEELEKALEEIPQVPFILQQYIHPVKRYTTRVEVVGNEIMTVLKRYVGEKKLSSYHVGSTYEHYTDCPKEIIENSKQALKYLHIEMGSLDIVEIDDEFYIIDVNATSNFSEDNVQMLGFNPMKVMAEYIETKYRNRQESINISG